MSLSAQRPRVATHAVMQQEQQSPALPAAICCAGSLRNLSKCSTGPCCAGGGDGDERGGDEGGGDGAGCSSASPVALVLLSTNSWRHLHLILGSRLLTYATGTASWAIALHACTGERQLLAGNCCDMRLPADLLSPVLTIPETN